MPTVELLTEGEIEERRRALLDMVGMSEEELRERGEAYALSVREVGILTELDGLDFLLGR